MGEGGEVGEVGDIMPVKLLGRQPRRESPEAATRCQLVRGFAVKELSRAVRYPLRVKASRKILWMTPLYQLYITICWTFRGIYEL